MNEEQQQRLEVESRLTPQGIVAAYLVELNEYRSDLFSALKMGSLTPKVVLDFVRTFRKFFDITSIVISDGGLKSTINKWFEGINAKTLSNISYMQQGVELSVLYQDAISASGIFIFFSEPIVPPFLIKHEIFNEELIDSVLEIEEEEDGDEEETD